MRVKRYSAAGLVLLLAALVPLGCGGGGGGAASGGTRTVEHALGETAVPGDPRRVVSLNSFGTLDELLALGIEPVGSVALPGEEPFAPWLRGQTGSIERIGATAGYEPNLEQVATLEPDLIIGPEFNVEGIYDELSRIAPTVAVPEDPDDPHDFVADTRFVAGAVGREGKGKELIEDYRRRLEGLREGMGERLGETEVSVIRYYADNQIGLEGYEGYVGTLLRDAGVRRPPKQRIEKGVVVNFERTDLMAGDVVFAYGVCDPAMKGATDETRRSLKGNPLWQRLGAVKGGEVYEVDPCLWGGSGIRWADLIVDDLNKYLVEDGTGDGGQE